MAAYLLVHGCHGEEVGLKLKVRKAPPIFYSAILLQYIGKSIMVRMKLWGVYSTRCVSGDYRLSDIIRRHFSCTLAVAASNCFCTSSSGDSVLGLAVVLLDSKYLECEP